MQLFYIKTCVIITLVAALSFFEILSTSHGFIFTNNSSPTTELPWFRFRNRIRTTTKSPSGAFKTLLYTNDSESGEEFTSNDIRALVSRLVRNTDDIREKIRQHMETTQRTLAKLTEDIAATKTMLSSRSSNNDNYVLKAVSPGLSHTRRLKKCLSVIPTNTDYNNSLTINYPETEREEMQILLTLYNLRACILEDSLEWWLKQILSKAGISGLPKATLFEGGQVQIQSNYYDLGEEYNKLGTSNPLCMNVVKLKNNISMILVFPGTCVRLYSGEDCLGENRIFASYRNETLTLHNEIDGFEKRTQSIGKCFT